MSITAPGCILSGILTDTGGNPYVGVVSMVLCNYGTGIPSITGGSILAQLVVSTQSATNGTFSLPFYGNFQITTPNSTCYQINIQPLGGVATPLGSNGLENIYLFPATGNYDLSTIQPITVVPVGTVPIPPSSTYVLPGATSFSLGGVELAAGQTSTTLSTVATTGQYSDLLNIFISSLTTTGSGAASVTTGVLNVPTYTLPGATSSTLGGVELAGGQTSTTLAKVATTGAYGDLTGTPSAAYITSLTTSGSTGVAAVAAGNLNIPAYVSAPARVDNTNGSYIQFADGTIIQWGTVTPSGGGNQSISVTFPIAFTTTTKLEVNATCANGAGNCTANIQGNPTTSGCTLYLASYVYVGGSGTTPSGSEVLHWSARGH